MAYVSPIDRMAAIAGAAQSIDQSNAYRDQMPLQQRLAQLRVSGAEGELHSMQQRQGMLDKQLKETDLGARAYSLAQMDDATLMQELPRQMPQFYEAGKFEGATPDQYRQRLGGIANYAASKGYIQIPSQRQSSVPDLIEEAQYFYPNDPEKQREYAERRTRGGSLTPEEYAARQKSGVIGKAQGESEAAKIPGSEASLKVQEAEIKAEEAKSKRMERERKAMDEAKAAETKATAARRYSSIVFEDIGRAIETVESNPIFTTGLVGGQVLKNLGGTDAADLNSLLDTVEAGIAFDRLQAMRDASPTGGALGQVSELEITLLKAALGSVKQSQSAPQLKRNLERMRDIYSEIVHGQPEPPSAQIRQAEEADIQSLIDKYAD